MTACIVTHNRRMHLWQALESINNQSYPRLEEVIVVDNGSTDDSCGIVEERMPEARYIRLEENRGCAAARNIAMQAARTDYIVHIDDDGILEASAVAEAVRCCASDPKCAVVAMRVIEVGDAQAREEPPESCEGLLRVFSGGACVMRREVVQEAGYFDERYVRQSEEADLCVRLHERGYVIRYCPRAVLFHKSVGKEGSDRRAARLAWELVNTTSMAVKHAPIVLLLGILGWRWSRYGVKLLLSGRLDRLVWATCTIISRIPEDLRRRDVCSEGFRVHLGLPRVDRVPEAIKDRLLARRRA